MPPPTMQGYAPPSVTQFSVFLDNKVGKLLDLVEAFDGSTCEICAVSVHEASDHAVVRLITNDSRLARDLLRAEGLPFSELDVLVVELGAGHSLSTMCLHLLAAELNIRFAYPLMLKPNGKPTIAIAVDDLTLAGQILRRKEYRLLGEFDLPRTG
ncbi:MAG: acetolactate synthase [Planctomycetota bacterium]